MLQLLTIGWLAATVLGQTDNSLGNRIPLWLIGLVLLIIIFAVVWTLYEEEGKKGKTETFPEPTFAAHTMEVETAVTPPDPISAQPDDLTKIEGIGPKISRLLQDTGIVTFAQLATAEVETLRHILAEAKLRIANPESWPEQAALAAAGDWEALQKLQDNLKGGRRA